MFYKIYIGPYLYDLFNDYVESTRYKKWTSIFALYHLKWRGVFKLLDSTNNEYKNGGCRMTQQNKYRPKSLYIMQQHITNNTIKVAFSSRNLFIYV